MESKVSGAYGGRDRYLRETLKERAYFLLKQYGRGGPPYDPYRIAEGMGVEVEDCDLNGIDGFVEVVGGKYVASLSRRVSAYRRRFTLAHELCHVLLMRRAEDGKPLPLVRYRTSGASPYLHQDPQEESLCNYFAGELLAPSEEVRAYTFNKPVTPKTIYKVASRYLLSTQAAALQVMGVNNRKKLGCAFWNLESLWPMPLWWYGLKTECRSELQLLEGAVSSRQDFFERWESFNGQRRPVVVRSSPTPECRYSMMVITARDVA